MATTSHLELTLLEQSQAQKEITINEALARIDAVLNCGVIDRDLATPPGSPAAGDTYIVAASPTGAWSGKAGYVAYFDQVWRFITPREGLMLWVNDEDKRVVHNGTGWQLVDAGGGSTDFATVVEGRLSLSSGVPVSTADVTAATTLYFTPYTGNRIALYNGTSWELKSFSELSIAVPATTNTLYDVWAYNNSGAVALEITAWTNDTTRATALALQNGAYVKSGAATRRYLGSFRTTGISGQTEDSRAKRFVWNYHNRALRLMAVIESGTSWSYSTNSWRQVNNSTANQIAFVRGVNEDLLCVNATSLVSNSTTTLRAVMMGIGEDTTTAVAMRYNQQAVSSVATVSLTGYYDAYPSAGYHYLAWLERGAGADTQTWYGESRFGIFGQLWG